MRSNIFVGLDLGQARDHTALAVLEQAGERYNLRRLERLPLHTSYPSVVEHVRGLVSRPQLRGCNLVVDQSGVGRPVVDLLRQAALPCDLVPVTITGGNSESFDADGWRVSKVALVSSLIVVVQSRRLAAPPELPLAETLVKELEGFGTQVTASGHEVFSARSGQHDDLVLAASLAAWWAERPAPRPPTIDGPLVWNRPWPPRASSENVHPHVATLRDLGIWDRMMRDD